MNKKTKIPIYLTGLLIFAMFMANYGNYQLAAIPSRIYQAYGLNDAQFSSLMTGPMVPSVFFSIVCGVLADRIGIKKVLSVGMIIAVIGYVLRVYAGGYGTMLIAMMLSGFAAMTLNANISKLSASIYPPEKIGAMVGVLMAASTGSMAVAYGTTAMIPTLKMVYWVAAALCIACTVLWIFTVKESTFTKNTPSPESIPVMEALKVSAKSANIWILGLALMFLMGGAMVVSNFQVGALCALKGYDEASAGTYATVLMIGSLIGSLVIPIAAAKMREKTGVFVLVITAIAAICVVGIVVLPSAGIYVASFLNGALRSGALSVGLSLPVMFKEIGPKYAGTAGGFVVTLELLGAVVIPTYVIVPLAGAGNYYMFFALGGLSILLCAVLLYVVIRRSRVFS